MQYYHGLITEKSFQILQDLKRHYQFILIGGWAVFLYTKNLKSKDIDVVIEYGELENLKKNFTLHKNDRLKKYEIKIEEVDIDLYIPFYSNPGLPAEVIKGYTQNIEGFILPKPEILLILKQKAYIERLGTPKGEKDKIDIIGLLQISNFNWDLYKKLLAKYNLKDNFVQLKQLLKTTTEIPELELNKFRYAKLKKKILKVI